MFSLLFKFVLKFSFVSSCSSLYSDNILKDLYSSYTLNISMARETLKSIVGGTIATAGLSLLLSLSAMSQTNTNYTTNNTNKPKTEQSYKLHNPFEGTVISVK